MTDEDYVAELRSYGMLSTNQAADRIEALTAELAAASLWGAEQCRLHTLYLAEAGNFRGKYKAADRIMTLAAERDEAINQLDSAIHSQIVLEKRTAVVMEDRRLIVEERDRTFALMLARAEAAEAERDRLREALLDHNDLLRSAIAIAEREGVRGEIAATNWDAYYNRAAVVLKRHHQITTDARAALKGESHE